MRQFPIRIRGFPSEINKFYTQPQQIGQGPKTLDKSSNWSVQDKAPTDYKK